MCNRILYISRMLTLLGQLTMAQQPVTTGLKPNWYNLDLQKDSVFGISMEKAYTELLKGKMATPVIVAVLDGGVDVNHEDLKANIWINK